MFVSPVCVSFLGARQEDPLYRMQAADHKLHQSRLGIAAILLAKMPHKLPESADECLRVLQWAYQSNCTREAHKRNANGTTEGILLPRLHHGIHQAVEDVHALCKGIEGM